MQRSIRSLIAAVLLGLAALCAALRADAQQIGPIPGCTISGGTITCGGSSLTPVSNLTGPITSVGNATSIAAQTGTGTTFVVQSSPSLTTPNINVATGTSLALGGATIGTNALAITGTSAFAGTLTFSTGSINGPAAVSLSAGGNVQFSTRSRWTSPADGSFQFLDQAQVNSVVISFPTATATPTLQFGAADAAVAVAQITRVQSVVAGTAAASGANWTLIGSLPTGTGTSGDIIVQTGVKTGSGTTQGTATTALTWKGETQRTVFNAPFTRKGYTVATLPAGNTGDSAYVSDAVACTFLAGLTGGAATFCPVIYNGSAWVAD